MRKEENIDWLYFQNLRIAAMSKSVANQEKLKAFFNKRVCLKINHSREVAPKIHGILPFIELVVSCDALNTGGGDHYRL